MTADAERAMSGSPGPVPNEQVLRLRRAARIPDRLRLARFRAAPQFGPRIQFFSGGTALNAVSRRLVEYTHNSIHVITPFDSGGSSGKLRGPFKVPAVGDLRSRLMALADQTVRGQAEVFDAFAHRLPADRTQEAARRHFVEIVEGRDPIIARIERPMRDLICNHLRFVAEQLPARLDLRGASIGNLVLVGGYLNNRADIDAVIYLFSKLVEARGSVYLSTVENLHLAATLEDGTTVVGQRELTGKEAPPIRSPVREVYLIRDLADAAPASAEANERATRATARADLICFPMGSFYSSVLANLLPAGIGSAVARNPCSKVYVPNTLADPEQIGMSLSDGVRQLLRALQRDCGGGAAVEDLLNVVVIDERDDAYAQRMDVPAVREMGVQVLRAPLVAGERAPLIDEAKLLSVLLSLS
jgi:CofD-related protein of GAK system